jgi:Trypsin
LKSFEIFCFSRALTLHSRASAGCHAYRSVVGRRQQVITLIVLMSASWLAEADTRTKKVVSKDKTVSHTATKVKHITKKVIGVSSKETMPHVSQPLLASNTQNPHQLHRSHTGGRADGKEPRVRRNRVQKLLPRWHPCVLLHVRGCAMNNQCCCESHRIAVFLHFTDSSGTGSLLSPCWVLTAQHCCTDEDGNKVAGKVCICLDATRLCVHSCLHSL